MREDKIRMAMIGAGPDKFIGRVHHMASKLDGEIELVAGCFSSSARKSKRIGRECGLDPKRVYTDYREMLEKESKRDDRPDLVSIVMPNAMHFAAARDALEAGFHVIADKPLTTTVDDARELARLAKRKKRVFALTHNYTGYPMARLAKEIIQGGQLGDVFRVSVVYPQGGAAKQMAAGNATRRKRTATPSANDLGGCLSDIGTHAENLVNYITGLRVDSVCADVEVLTNENNRDEDAQVLLRFEGGARGILHSSKVCLGPLNGLAIVVYCERGNIEWRQEAPETLTVGHLDGRLETIRRGAQCVRELSPLATEATRLPGGHPEGFVEAFANIYRGAAEAVRARNEKRDPDPLIAEFPTVDDGLRGMLFVQTVLESAKSKQKWLKVPKR